MNEATQNYERADVAMAMQKYGGSFVEHLGKALFYADANNTERIKNAFPEYWNQYGQMAEIERKRRA